MKTVLDRVRSMGANAVNVNTMRPMVTPAIELWNSFFSSPALLVGMRFYQTDCEYPKPRNGMSMN